MGRTIPAPILFLGMFQSAVSRNSEFLTRGLVPSTHVWAFFIVLRSTKTPQQASSYSFTESSLEEKTDSECQDGSVEMVRESVERIDLVGGMRTMLPQ